MPQEGELSDAEVFGTVLPPSDSLEDIYNKMTAHSSTPRGDLPEGLIYINPNQVVWDAPPAPSSARR